MKFMTHPVANLVQERLKAYSVSMDRQHPFHRFHFANRWYDYDFLKAEYESEMYHSGQGIGYDFDFPETEDNSEMYYSD